MQQLGVRIGTRYRVTLKMTEAMLGTVAKQREAQEYVLAQAQQAIREVLADGGFANNIHSEDTNLDDERATLPEPVEERGITGFHVLDGNLVVYDYMIRGFFKAACGFMRRVEGSESAKVKSYKQQIDGLIFVKPRRIVLRLPEGAQVGILERPLRAETMQGPRVAIARSETVPPGTQLSFTVHSLPEKLSGVPVENLLREWLEFGSLHGLGQWRSGGWGTFEVVEFERV